MRKTERGGVSLKIVVYSPKDERKIHELCSLVAYLHAKADACYLNSLTCPLEQKKAIVQMILKEKKNSRPSGDSAE